MKYGSHYKSDNDFDNIEKVKQLLEDPEFDANEQQLLHHSCYNGNIDIVKLLLGDPRIDINNDDNDEYETSFFNACKHGYLEIVKLFIDYDGSEDNELKMNLGDRNGLTPFSIACYYGYIDIVKLLLENMDIDVNSGNHHGKTPFHIACSEGHYEIVKLLMNDPRIDITKQELSVGFTGFHYACAGYDYNTEPETYIKMINLFFEDGRLNPNEQGKYGTTPLHVACAKRLNIVQLMLQNETVNPHLKNNEGMTPLHYACTKNAVDIVEYMLKNRDDLIIPDGKFSDEVNMVLDKYR